jgi:hypothetical protein
MATRTKDAPVYCDCCGVDRRVKMADIRDGRLTILDKRHGRRHVAVVVLDKLNDRNNNKK